MRTRRMQRRAIGIGLASALAALLGGAPQAGAQTVTVTNLGQPGMISSVPQPPFAVASHGNCPHARTLQEALGEPGPCPPATWPEPGKAGWAPALAIAVGDAVALDFETAPDQVLVSITTNVDPTVRPPTAAAPPGAPQPTVSQRWPVADEFGPVVVTPSDDPKRWTAMVPELPTYMFPLAVAVTAVTGAAGENFPFELQTPRWSVFDSNCGESWQVPGPARVWCPRDAVPPGIPMPPAPEQVPVTRSAPVTRSPPATSEPAATLRLASTARTASLRLRDGQITVPLRASVPGRLRVQLSWRGRSLGTRVQPVARGGQVTVRVPVTARRADALQARRTRVVRLSAELTPRAGASASAGASKPARVSRTLSLQTR